MKLTEAFKLIAVIFLTVAILTGCSKEEIEKRKTVRLLNEIKENLQKDNFEEVIKRSLFIVTGTQNYQRGFFLNGKLSLIFFPLEFLPLNDYNKKLFLHTTVPTFRL
ncbi:MAG: hypothetical protein HY761_11285 [Candidatus Omnitrophica bacterium]|nr:hypothetical protein [Candidatus Omnitrophota bacterium]